MKDIQGTLFEFAEAVLAGRDLLRRADSFSQAANEAEGRIARLAAEEASAAARIVKAEKQTVRDVDALLDRAKAQATACIVDAEERANAIKSGAALSLHDLQSEVDRLEQIKKSLLGDLAALRSTVSMFDGQKQELLHVIADLKSRLAKV